MWRAKDQPLVGIGCVPRPDRHQGLTSTRKCCAAVLDLPAAMVSNVDGTPPIERQLHGSSIVKSFLMPESCHPGAPAPGPDPPPKSTHCRRRDRSTGRQTAVVQVLLNSGHGCPLQGNSICIVDFACRPAAGIGGRRSKAAFTDSNSPKRALTVLNQILAVSGSCAAQKTDCLWAFRLQLYLPKYRERTQPCISAPDSLSVQSTKTKSLPLFTSFTCLPSVSRPTSGDTAREFCLTTSTVAETYLYSTSSPIHRWLHLRLERLQCLLNTSSSGRFRITPCEEPFASRVTWPSRPKFALRVIALVHPRSAISQHFIKNASTPANGSMRRGPRR